MDAFWQLFIIATTSYATLETFKLVKDKTRRWEHIAVFFTAWAAFGATETNLFTAFGISGEGDLFYIVSYFLSAVLTVQGAGWVHDIKRRIDNG